LTRFPAESALVARLLLDPSEIQKVSDLSPEDFYGQDARQAFQAILRLSAAGRPIDITTVRAEAGNDDLDIDLLSLTRANGAPIEEYARIIRDAATRVEAIEAESLGVLDLRDFRSPPPDPLLGVLSPEGTTVLYGEGGDGKGWIAAKWASQLSKMGIGVAVLDFEQHPSEWAYRLNKFGDTKTMYINPTVTLDKWADERATKLLRSCRIGYLVVDSATYASDIEDPYAPAAPIAYQFAMERLGKLPSLLLAHTAKGSEGIYGSVFWRNQARITWHLVRHGITRQRSIECRKANAYGQLEGQRINIEFDERQGILNLHQHGTPWAPAQPQPAGHF